MKTTRNFFLAVLVFFFLGTTFTSRAHCEIPCGIYGDSLRMEMIQEHITTIEKSMEQIELLTGEDDKDFNQIEFYGKNKYFSNFFYLLFLQCQRTTDGETLCRWS